jgi:hypothetical protein
MATFRIPARLIVAGAGAAAIAAAPGVLLWASVGPTPHAVADCPGSINYGILNEGTPVQNGCPGSVPSSTGGGAPSEGTLSACSGVPGCLSNALYGPGNVQVPKPNTTVHQSQ